MVYHAWFAVQVALAWYAALSLAAALLALALRPALRTVLRRRPPANALLALRVLPAALSSAVVAILVLPAFGRLESFGSAARGERLGITAVGLAVCGAALVLWSLARGLTAAVVTRRRMRALRVNTVTAAQIRSEIPVLVGDAPVPCVVLDGFVRPRLLVSRSVWEQLTADELERAVAHEVAHHRAHDNVKRRILAFAPDLISGTPLARELEAAWAHAAEVEADAEAAASEAQALALASALVKVARLAEGKRVELGRAAFHDGTPVADRIRMLCACNPVRAHRVRATSKVLGATIILLLIGLVLNAASILRATHHVTELLVHLP